MRPAYRAAEAVGILNPVTIWLTKGMLLLVSRSEGVGDKGDEMEVTGVRLMNERRR